MKRPEEDTIQSSQAEETRLAVTEHRSQSDPSEESCNVSDIIWGEAWKANANTPHAEADPDEGCELFDVTRGNKLERDMAIKGIRTEMEYWQTGNCTRRCQDKTKKEARMRSNRKRNTMTQILRWACLSLTMRVRSDVGSLGSSSITPCLSLTAPVRRAERGWSVKVSLWLSSCPR